MRIVVPIYKGLEINRDLSVTFIYDYDKEGEYPTITRRTSGSILIRTTFALSISERFGGPMLFCTGNMWYPFANLLRRSIKLIQENLYSIFPSLGKLNWDDVDTGALERFQTEKCMYIKGFSIIPIVYNNRYNESFPGIKISNNRNESVMIPLEDAIIISDVISNIEPNTYGMHCLRVLQRLE